MNGLRATFRRWFDSGEQAAAGCEGPDAERIDWLRVVPFLGLHVACLGVLAVGVSAVAVWTAVGLFALRMFAITAFYHRYFSHRAFKTSRALQLIFALLGTSAVQRGPLWWAAHHRVHHRESDTENDTHSPRQGMLHAHVGWFLTRKAYPTRIEQVPDLARFPELRWVDRYDVLMPVLLAVALLLTGIALEAWAPGLGTSGAQMVVWGFCISTVALYHATFTINSLAHRFGSRRYETGDDSRNNLWLALLTFGEGWHNNHHRFPGAARQGFRWYEVDLSWYLLWLMSRVGLVWDLRGVPQRVREEGA